MTVHHLKKQIYAGAKLTFLGLYSTISIFEIAIRKISGIFRSANTYCR